jgi:hypothetical protein
MKMNFHGIENDEVFFFIIFLFYQINILKDV